MHNKQDIGHLIRYSVQQQGAAGASKTAVFSAHGLYFNSNVDVPAPENLNMRFLGPHGNFLADPTVDFLVNSQGRWSSFVDMQGRVLTHNDLRRPDLNMPHQPDRSLEQSSGTSQEGNVRDYQYFHYENDPKDSEIFKILTTNAHSVLNGRGAKMDLLTLSDTVQDPRTSDSDASFSLADLIAMHNNGQLVNSAGLPYETLVMSHCRNFAGYPEDPTYSYHSNPALDDYLKGQALAGMKIEQLVQSTVTFDAQGTPVIRETVLGFIVLAARSRVEGTTPNTEQETER